MNNQWQIFNTYIVYKNNKTDLTNCKIAAFDLDDTLIKTKSNKEFAVNETDWQLYDNILLVKLKKLIDEGYKLVIITNQLGISKGKVDINIWKKKIENFINFTKLEFTILASVKDDMYRKPRDKFWTLINGEKVNSFYCGDAGGLKKRKINNIEINKDFSDSDLKFAINLGIKFIHRDEFMFGLKYTEETYSINYPMNFNKLQFDDYLFKPNKPEIIINIGLPASGKSTFFIKKISPHKYIYINQDTLKTQKKCLLELEKALEKKESVVIDNTNLTKEIRQKYIDIANKYSYKYRCLNFTASKDICMHNSFYRNYQSNNLIETIPKIVYNIMNKKYEKPELSEGFYDIIEIEFKINLNENERNIYEKYYF